MYHEIASNLVGVYVRVVAPSEGHPSRTLMTSDLQRSWRWWNGGINDAFDFWIDVEVFEDPAAVGTLTWMMRAAGARSVVVVRTTCRGLVTPAAEAGCSAADRAFVAAFGPDGLQLTGVPAANWRSLHRWFAPDLTVELDQGVGVTAFAQVSSFDHDTCEC